MCTVLLPPGDNPIAVNNYINMNSSNYINTNVLCTILLLSVTFIIISCCLNLYRNVQLAVWIQLRRAVVAVTAVVYRSPTTRHTSVSVPVQSLLVIFDIRRKKKDQSAFKNRQSTLAVTDLVQYHRIFHHTQPFMASIAKNLSHIFHNIFG